MEYVDHYTYRVTWSEEEQQFLGLCSEMPSLSAFADDRFEAMKQIIEVVKTSVAWIMEEGQEAPQPIATGTYKGNFSVRTTPEKHREIVLAAAESHVSMNQYVLSKLG
jgi:predicted HicB family RNase H-like nuclease